MTKVGESDPERDAFQGVPGWNGEDSRITPAGEMAGVQSFASAATRSRGRRRVGVLVICWTFLGTVLLAVVGLIAQVASSIG